MMCCSQAAAPPAPPKKKAADAPWILWRTGLRPLQFHGRLLLQAEDTAAPAWSRIRLALYAADDSGFVTEIMCVPGGIPVPRPWCHAARVATLGAACADFEAVQPQAETSGIGAPQEHAAAMLLGCAQRLRQEEAQIHIVRHAIGGFLYRLCLQ
jgi:hypothetical protein